MRFECRNKHALHPARPTALTSSPVNVIAPTFAHPCNLSDCVKRERESLLAIYLIIKRSKNHKTPNQLERDNIKTNPPIKIKPTNTNVREMPRVPFRTTACHIALPLAAAKMPG